MGNKPFTPPIPHIDPPSQEAIDTLNSMTPKDCRKFKKSSAYKKHVQPVVNRDKARKRQARKEWWWSKGIVILNTLLALIAAITGIIALLR
mgnify:CR=1 FL=1